MSTDLRSRLERAVGDVEPRRVDTDAIWSRGRRQRRIRRATPVVAVLLIVGLGVATVASVAGRAPDRQPLDSIEDGRNPSAGWTVVEPGTDVTTDRVLTAAADDVEVVARLLGHPNAPFAISVRDDGAIVTVLQDIQGGGIVVKHPGDDGWTRLGMPVPFLTDDAGFAITTIQWGPDGRIYVTGTAPAAARRGMGLTQVVVLEEDGVVVGVRENDDGQTNGFLFTDGYAWQAQTSDPDRQRWQPVVELGGRVLPMPEQRAGDRQGLVAPDGMSLTYDHRGAGGPTFEARTSDGRSFAWRSSDGTGVGVWSLTPPDLRIGATLPTRPGSGPLAWLSDTQEPDGVVLHAVRSDGRIAAVHLPPEVIEQPGMLVNGADATIGGDDRVHWVTHTPDGPMLLRYRHPIP